MVRGAGQGPVVTGKELAELHEALRWQEGSKKRGDGGSLRKVGVWGRRGLALMRLTEQVGCGLGADGELGGLRGTEVMRRSV